MKLVKTICALVAAAAAITSFAVTTAAEDVEYNAYLGFQSAAYSFRNKWDDATYGKDTAYFDKAIVWGDTDTDPDTYPDYADYYDYDIEAYALPVTYTDTKITGDGTYTVSMEGFDWALDKSTGFNLIYVDTDIPLESGAVVSNVKVLIDGVETANLDTSAVEPEQWAYVMGTGANIWNTTIPTYTGAYPTSTLAVEFTVTGLGAAAADEAAPAEEAEATDEAAPAEEATEATDDAAATEAADAVVDTTAAATDDKGNADTGVEGVAAIAGIAVLAAGAVIVAKRKNK